jgi:hypothetical protein
MPVSSTRREYNTYKTRWKLVRDVINSNVSHYIPEIEKSDKIRCQKYREGAQFTNFTSRTKSGLVGAIFRKDVIVELPDDIEYLIQDATGQNVSLSKLAQEGCDEVLQTGRWGLLTDYPISDENLSVADVESMNLKARIYAYKAESIINWNETVYNGVTKVSLVVIKECIEKLMPDGFEWSEETQYRVLRLIDGEYVQYLYNQEEQLVSFYTPKDSEGNSWDYIPFEIAGSENNNMHLDSIPMYDLSRLNIGHLINSADFEESVHITGQPTLIFSTDMSQEMFEAVNPDGIKIGARRGHNLGPTGKAEFLQANPNQLADEAMKRKEEQAVMMGARLITPQADRETAEAARMRHSGETSILALVASNVEQALRRSCEHALRFMGSIDTKDQIQLELNNKFFDSQIDPNLIMAQIQLLNNRLVAPNDVRKVLKQYGVLDEARTDTDIDGETTHIIVPQDNLNSTIPIDK